MSEPTLKCENNAIFKYNYTLKVFMILNWPILDGFDLRGNVDIPDFLQEITSTAGPYPK